MNDATEDQLNEYAKDLGRRNQQNQRRTTMATGMTELIEKIQLHIGDIRELLHDFERELGEDSDVSNENNIMQANAGLDLLEGCVGDLIP